MLIILQITIIYTLSCNLMKSRYLKFDRQFTQGCVKIWLNGIIITNFTRCISLTKKIIRNFVTELQQRYKYIL